MNILKKIFGLRTKENKKVDTIPDELTEYAEEKINSIEDVMKGLSFTFNQRSSSTIGTPELKDELEKNDFEPINENDDIKDKIQELKKITENIDTKIISNTDYDASINYKIDYLNELNSQQFIAVTTTETPLLVIAGAGSGKTRVITYKVSYLIEKGINPNSILLLTFTKKAANEMLNRVEKLLANKSTSSVLGGTFHSFSNYVLRKFGNLIGISNSFSIIDTEDASDIIDLLKTELNISGKKKGIPFPKKSKIQTIISKSKNLECNISEIVKKYYNENFEYVNEIETIAQAFEIYKKTANLLDYDDLMLILRDNLKKNSQFKRAIQKSIEYILVDEYQDTNNAQREIVELLADKNGKITVVGDDSQSIYAFRGANFENILRFPQNLPNCGVVKIEENYRSEQGILNFTNDIILNAKIGFKKNLFSQRVSRKKPIIKRLSDGIAEAEYIVNKILEIRENNLDYKDFAILTRASWHSNYVQTELIKRKIPFIVVGGIKFSERRHIKDIVAFIKITINSIDAIAWHRVLQLIEGIGKIRAKEIVQVIHNNKGIIDFSGFEKRKYYQEIKVLQDLFNKVIDEKMPVLQIIEHILNYYRPILKQLEDDFEVRNKDLDIFISIAQNYNSIENFLADFTLEPPSNRYQDETTPNIRTDEKPLVVSTIHSSKGLEWHTVFIPFALDGLLPSSKSFGSIEEIEEERRLFYVASTRAKENLFITMPSYVSSWDAVFTKPSRFIYEVKSEYYVIEN
ncbi:MAG TPA: ATP-dependent helicase [Ignavibacteria bacterium]|nr:ATP-dependent helicase [Ignavibacteria bacterium]